MKMREMNGILLYELPSYAYKKYIKRVRGNNNLSHSVAQQKLTRCIMLAKCIKKDDIYNQEIYLYGSLKIRINNTIDGRKVITGIWDRCQPDPYWMLNEKEYRKLSKKLDLRINR